MRPRLAAAAWLFVAALTLLAARGAHALDAGPVAWAELAAPLDPTPLSRELELKTIPLGPGVDLTVEHAHAALFKELGGASSGVALTGSMHVHLAPSDPVEAAQLERFTKHRILDSRVKEAVIWTRVPLFPGSPPPVPMPAGVLGELVGKQIEFLLKAGADPRPALLGAADPAFSLALLHTHLHGWIAVLHDPRSAEPLTVGAFDTDWARVNFQPWTAERRGEDRLPARIDHYRIRVHLDKGVEVETETTTDVRFLLPETRVLRFDLSRRLRVRAVTGEDGAPVAFVQAGSVGEHEPGRLVPAVIAASSITVFLPQAPAVGSTLRLTFAGRGDLMDRVGDDSFRARPDGWFPTLGYLERATFELDYDYPEKMQLASVGTAMETSVAAGRIRARYRLDRAVAVAGFAYGKFEVREGKTGSTKLRVLANKGRMDYGPAVVNPGGVAERLVGSIGEDIAFHAARYGPFPFDKIEVSEARQSYGQGWPGLLYLAPIAFLDGTGRLGASGRQFAEYEFPSHEVAHQWWGHLVGWKSYRDQWLSEGFAEYAAILELRAAEGLDAYVRRLTRIREQLLQVGTGGARATEAGPIALGVRLTAGPDPNAYQAVIYGKGAYVLRMIHDLLTDHSKEDDSRYFKLMAAFARDFAWKNASTDDFRQAVEAETKSDMRPFFAQWVEGTSIPRVEVSARAVDGPGKYNLELSARVSGVAAGFSASMPVHLYLGNRKMPGRLTLKVPESVVVVPLSAKPSRIEWNAGAALLVDLHGD